MRDLYFKLSIKIVYKEQVEGVMTPYNIIIRVINYTLFRFFRF